MTQQLDLQEEHGALGGVNEQLLAQHAGDAPEDDHDQRTDRQQAEEGGIAVDDHAVHSDLGGERRGEAEEYE